MLNPLLDKIGSIESAKGYNFEYGNTPLDLENMTLGEVLAHQENQISDGKDSSAVGRYQFKRSTLASIVDRNSSDFPMDAKFTPEMQDKAAGILLDRRGYQDFKSGDLSENDFMKNLSQEWASLPDPDTGKSYYDKDGLNKSLVGGDEILNVARSSIAPQTQPPELLAPRVQPTQQPVAQSPMQSMTQLMPQQAPQMLSQQQQPQSSNPMAGMDTSPMPRLRLDYGQMVA